MVRKIVLIIILVLIGYIFSKNSNSENVSNVDSYPGSPSYVLSYKNNELKIYCYENYQYAAYFCEGNYIDSSKLFKSDINQGIDYVIIWGEEFSFYQGFVRNADAEYIDFYGLDKIKLIESDDCKMFFGIVETTILERNYHYYAIYDINYIQIQQ